MKYIKLYEEYTSGGESDHPGFLSTREDIKSCLDSMGIEGYIIKDDLTVDVNGDVQLNNRTPDYIPVQFGVVSGAFYCYDNNLTSLKGCPTKVGEGFFCNNNNLTSVEHCPTKVGGEFYCANNNLTSLEHCPTKIGGNFDCSYNNLTSLENSPTKIFGYFDCSNNNLISLENGPTKAGWYFSCSNNNLTSLKGCPTEVGGSFYCYNNIIVSEIQRLYYGDENPSWETDDLELISSRFFDKFEGLDVDTKVDVLNTLKKLEPEFYNSAAFQAYNPDSMLGRMERSKDATRGLFEL